MYPFRSKVSEARKAQKEAETLSWSEAELARVFGGDVARLKRLRERESEVASWAAENSDREVLKARATEQVRGEIAQLEAAMKNKLKTSVYNTQSHQAGYEVDVQASVDQNWSKCMAMAC